MGDRANPGSIEALLENADWLNRLARHLASADIAEDAVQETWIAVARTPPEPGRPPQPWLAEVLRNFVRRRRRSDDRRSRREDALWDPGAIEPGVDDLYERVELQRRIAERVMALDE